MWTKRLQNSSWADTFFVKVRSFITTALGDHLVDRAQTFSTSYELQIQHSLLVSWLIVFTKISIFIPVKQNFPVEAFFLYVFFFSGKDRSQTGVEASHARLRSRSRSPKQKRRKKYKAFRQATMGNKIPWDIEQKLGENMEKKNIGHVNRAKTNYFARILGCSMQCRRSWVRTRQDQHSGS